jgi:drug/metabolite transporter (DMT)-like permease
VTAGSAIAAALLAALLFGASTPFAKLLVGNVSPILLAGLLYLGSGLGLWMIRLLRAPARLVPHLPLHEWPWLLGAIAAGGVIAPILLMYGLTQVSASSASLLLNLETVLTALIAWLVFRENADARIVLGVILIVAGGAVLAWPQAQAHAALGTLRGTALIAGACLFWAVDNNLTRKVSSADADFIAATKGLAAGTTNLGLALGLGAALPPAVLVLSATSVGFFGYGLSLVLFVLALRGLGSARTAAYFSIAPFLGAAIAVIALHEPTPTAFWLSACLMGVGVALHLSERHVHEHIHDPVDHGHSHVHDVHHRHAHNFFWDGTEPHVHQHHHEELVHDHPHYPDTHHRHRH